MRRRILLAVQHQGLRQARLDVGRPLGIGIADRHAEHREDVRRQRKLGGDLLGQVPHRANIDVPSPSDSAAIRALCAASAASTTPTMNSSI